MTTTPVRVTVRTPTRPTSGVLVPTGGSRPAGKPRRSHRSRRSWFRPNVEDWLIAVILIGSTAVALAAAADVAGTDTPAAQPAPTAPAETVPAAPVGPAAPAPGGTGCNQPDPTSSGCLTPAAAHGVAELIRTFGAHRNGPVLRAAHCWDEHAWNPSSDHPRGRACDIYTSEAGAFANGAGLDRGNQVAQWLRDNAEPLQVSYVIWQGRIWSPSKGDRKYTGGGRYDPNDPVGGHWDHIHVSFAR